MCSNHYFPFFSLKQGVSGNGARVMDDEVSYENTPNNAHMQTLKLGSTKSKLYIDCVSPTDVGQYTCVADTPHRRISTDTAVSISKYIRLDWPSYKKKHHSPTRSKNIIWNFPYNSALGWMICSNERRRRGRSGFAEVPFWNSLQHFFWRNSTTLR